MGKSNRRRRSKNKGKSVMAKPTYRFHLYYSYSSPTPQMSGYCEEIEAGNNGFWVRYRKGGSLSFYDHIAYAVVETLKYKK